MATELIRHYNRAHVSSRCMVKVNLRKAFDYVEWPFPFMVMRELGFPGQFIGWIHACVTSMLYYVLINGKHLLAFSTKKGLRQGGPYLLSCLLYVWST